MKNILDRVAILEAQNRRLQQQVDALVQTLDALRALGIGIPDTQTILTEGVDASTRREMRRIALEHCAASGFSLEAMQGPSRKLPLVYYRQDAMLSMHDEGYSYAQIGRFFGRDHSTVFYGVAAAKGRKAVAA